MNIEAHLVLQQAVKYTVHMSKLKYISKLKGKIRLVLVRNVIALLNNTTTA